MKRLFLCSMLMMVLFVSGVYSKDKNFFTSISGNFMFHSDSGFKDVYGSNVFMPEFKVGYYLSDSLLLWGGYGFFSKNGTTPELKIKTEAKQSFLSFGAGYQKTIGDNMSIVVLAGICSAHYEEKALGEKLSGNTTGFRIDGLLQYNISKSIYNEAGLGYTGASDSLSDDTDFKLGGFRLSAGFGFRF